MNIDDLRSELARRAEDAPHQGSHRDRMAGITAKRTAHRRPEGPLAAGVAVLAVLGWLVFTPNAQDEVDRPAGPTPASQAPEPDEPFAWPTEYAGDQLVASTIGDPGQSHVRLRFVPTTTDLHWASLCTAPWLKVAAQVSVNGHALGGSSCAADDRPGGPEVSFGDNTARNSRSWESLGVREGEVSVVEIKLPGGRSLPADARLGVGFFDRSGPRVTSDGVTIKRLWESAEGTYRLVAYRTQPLTAVTRELSLTVPEDVDDPVVLSGLDGHYAATRRSATITTVTGRDRRDVVDGFSGGGTGGGVIDNIAGETVTVREGTDGVNDGTLVIAIYAPID